jgi:hypothetical protein
MTNRREFLQVAAAVSAAPMAARAAQATDGLFQSPALHAVVVDRRFEASRAYGARWAESGLQVRTIDADVTRLWNEDLRLTWAQSPAGITGLTASPALFLLERLAWDHGMRVVFHAEHHPRRDGGLEHVILQGGAGLAAADIAAAGDLWPETLARALEGHPARAEGLKPTTAGLAPGYDEPVEVLSSWVIAPVSRA